MSLRVTEDRRGWLVAAALCMPLLVLLAVAGITWAAEQRYARVTQRVVHDYANIAAWQYARAANSALHDPVMAAFGPVSKSHQRTGPASPLLAPSQLLRRDEPPSKLRSSATMASLSCSIERSSAESDGTAQRMAAMRASAGNVIGVAVIISSYSNFSIIFQGITGNFRGQTAP